MNIPESMATWRAALRAAGRSPRTIASYLDSLRLLSASLPSPTVDQLTYQTIARYQRQIGQRLAPKSVALHLTAIRAYCRWLIDSEVRTDDPTVRIQWPKIPRTLPARALSRAQLGALLSALRQQPRGYTPFESFQWSRNRRAVYLMCYAGLRLSEAAALVWRDVDLEAGVLVVRHGKGAKDRAIPLHPMLRAELETIEDRADSDAVAGRDGGSPLSAKSLAHVFERFIPTLELGFRVTAHQLRHSFCTGLITNGVNAFEAQQLMGHASVQTTMRYVSLGAEHLRVAIQRLPEW